MNPPSLRMRRRPLLQGAAAAVALAVGGRVRAQEALWPEPLRLFIPFAAGGRSSFFARTLASALGGPVRIDNSDGDPMEAIRRFARGAPDGRELLLAGLRLPRAGLDQESATELLRRAFGNERVDSASGQVVLAQLATRMGRRNDENTLLTQLVPITTVARDPWVLVMNPARADALRIHDTPGLLRYLRAHPGGLSMATGNGSSIGTFASELFKSLTQTYFVRLSMPGLTPDIDMVADGRADLLFAPLNASRHDIRAGLLRALGTTARADDGPAGTDLLGLDRPLAPIQQAEPALTHFAAYSIYSLLAPPGTPPDVALRLQRACTQALALPAVRQTFARNNAIPGGETVAQFQQLEDDEGLRQVLAAARW